VLVKALRPDIKVIGVEPEDAASMTTAVRGGKRQTLDQVGIFADGVAVKMPGELTFELIKQHVDDFVTVSTDEICAAMKDLFDDTRAIAEPSGAVAAAGSKKWAAQQDAKNLTLINIVSGANMNFDRLRYVAERTEIGEQREGLLAVTIPEIPGTFLNFCTLLGTHNVTEFSYRYQSAERAQIFVGVELSGGRAQLDAIIEKLRAHGYDTENLTDNELAKSHLRYMIGGASTAVADERIFRFGFPERPGALMHFLQTLGTKNNISLFHYRNHGSDYGRVLAGIQSSDPAQLEAHLAAIGYDYSEETDNSAYRRFLQID